MPCIALTSEPGRSALGERVERAGGHQAGPSRALVVRATLLRGVTWSSSQVALGVAGLALLLALGCWFFAWMAIWRERGRRSQRVKEAVHHWAGSAATKAELEELRKTVAQLSTQNAEVAKRRRTVVEMAERANKHGGRTAVSGRVGIPSVFKGVSRFSLKARASPLPAQRSI